MIVKKKSNIIIIELTDGTASWVGLRRGLRRRRKSAFRGRTNAMVFSALFIYFFFAAAAVSDIYVHTMLSRHHCRIYIFTHTHTQTRGINLFKCYSEIISEHDRALRIYCVYTHI